MFTMERFWSRVDRSGECWLWKSSIDTHGYGHIWTGRRVERAHRIAYTDAVGPIPKGLELDHLCRVRACVRPDHLEAVTHAVNMARAETITQVNAAKVACDNGHPFDEANTYWRPSGHRDCRQCIRERVRRYKARAA